MAHNRVERLLVVLLDEAAADIRDGRWQAASHKLERTLSALRAGRATTTASLRTTPAVDRFTNAPRPAVAWDVRRSMNCARCGSAPGGWHEDGCLGTEY